MIDHGCLNLLCFLKKKNVSCLLYVFSLILILCSTILPLGQLEL
jgi:hypothetical protein